MLADPRGRWLLIGPPLIQLLVFGYAASFELHHVPIAIYDQDRSLASRDLVARFAGSPTFTVRASLSSGRRINRLIDSRRVQAVLVIERRFTRDLYRRVPAAVQVIVDGRNSNTGALIEGYAGSILTDFALDWSRAHGRKPPPAVLDVRALYNQTLDSHWFIIPGIVALLTQMVTLLVVGLSVAREREVGTFDQLLVTPLRRIDILIGKGLPGLLIGLIEASVIIAATVLWFHVPLRGSLLVLYLGLVLFVLAVTGIGLAISALSATQQQALLGAFLFMVPSVILSGFATPIANMPQWVQVLTRLNPMRYILVVIRGVFLRGAGAGELLWQLWPMALIAVGTLAAAGWLFRKRVS